MTVYEKRESKALDLLEESGVRSTPQRHAVLDYLLNTRVHPTAEEIYRELEEKFPHMSLTTVYNNLRVLREVGLVRELAFGNLSSRFDSNTTDHYHIICDECGKVVDFNYPILNEVESLARQLTRFEVSYHRMEVYGKCEGCQGYRKVQ
ncbi:Fur family transcriptional regulator [Halobacillus naozhouensis]|uniref:Fur family transcriptional regulator n=1 Tax=Halobacillus naozhouensis TaxID=554880 RepID=A0ABY8IZV8_9BACI|nr:Fur family transcriptional regulator [Halobacillus naozhouensis]WFT75610.1 Fur family transcriptional regulator [Halobacillus naozhouensis]